ncbi:MAG: fructose-bisphosphatase class I [Nitrospirae bacterium]|nr:fructose-bisphosphatase class I [Nitrospirota bacterium]
MQTLSKYLKEQGVGDELHSIFMSLKEGVASISEAIKISDKGKAGTENIYGEEQLALDVLSDEILGELFKKNEYVGVVASEELPDEMDVGATATAGSSKGEYAVCYDPLDGSSLVDVNLTVGTIVGIYKTDTFVGVKGDDQLASMIAVYGPSTTMILTVKKGVVKFQMDDKGEFVMCKGDIRVGEGKMFAPGNLRACAVREDYLKLVTYWMKEQYTLRYSGGMVPDINSILLKGKGIFSYPGYEDAPNGKLRILYECAPMSLLMEQAGGASTDGNVRILEKTVEKLDQRTPIFIGSKEEVARCEEYLSSQ